MIYYLYFWSRKIYSVSAGDTPGSTQILVD